MGKLVSIVIPTYDRQALTDRAVESILPSHPDIFEIVVVDDCGKLPYSYPGGRNLVGVDVRIFRLDSNVGPARARKFGVDHACGAVIAFLDSDDVFEPYWPDLVVSEVLKCNSESRGQLFIGGGCLNGSGVNRRFAEILPRIPDRWRTICLRLITLLCNPFYTPATAISKELCRFVSEIGHCEDYYTNAMAIFRGRRIVIIPQPACSISRRPGSPGGLSERRLDMFRGEFRVRCKLLGAHEISLCFRILMPLGMLYQCLREVLKSLINLPNVFTRSV